jgi:pSer/pThr/pTyr-binding forkhead associated (FHA) protein
MTRNLCILAAAAAGLALAQPPTQKMTDMSVQVYGVIPDGEKLKAVSLTGGWIVDAKHVVTYGLCCDKTDAGAQKTAYVHIGDKDVKSSVAWSTEDGLVILEIEGEANSAGVTLVPSKLAQKEQPIYTVQFSDKGEPSVTEGKLQDVVKAEKVAYPVIKATATADSVLKGGAMFDACGSVIGFNMVVDKGTQLAFVIDPLSAGFDKVGIKTKVADAACSAAGGQQSGGGGGGGQQGGGDQPPPDDGSFHLPHGTEWLGLGIIVVLALLATRKTTRDQVARVLTQRRPAYRPPAPYPNPAPAQYQASPQYPSPQYPQAPQYPQQPVQPVPVATKPVVRGLTGQYAGASIPVDARPSVMGRDQAAANLVFGVESDAVSKRHCSLRWDASRGTFVLEDLGSTNGTYLANGERVWPGQPRDLRSGDRFYVGDTRNQFEVRME